MLVTAEPHATAPPKLPVSKLEPVRRKLFAATNLILLIIAAFSLLGVAFTFWLKTVPAGNPDPRIAYNAFFVLFARNERLGLGLVAIFSIIGAILLRNRNQYQGQHIEINSGSRWTCIAVAALTFVVAVVGTQIVFHDYALTADEYLADFQARIFLAGKLQAPVASQFADAVRVLKPTFVEYFPITHAWNATYLPVYAAMRALFQYGNLQFLLNPVLAAVTILALYGTAQNIWPGKNINAFIAIGLLAVSPQFLVMAMTSYAMPAHLALNTIWLWLYSRPQRRGFYLAPVVGVLAIGLHQPFPHLLFVAPFLFRLVWERRVRATLIFAGIYAVGCIGWLAWRAHFQTSLPGGVGSVFRLWNPRMVIVQPMNLLLVIGWMSLAVPLLAVLGFRQFFRLPHFLQDCALSCLLTFGFYYFFYLDQAHGWGYRYFHGALSCFVLIAVAGWEWLSKEIGARSAKAFVTAGVLVSLLVQLPLRCVQAETFVRPFARAAAVLHAIPAQTVVIEPRDCWYSADLIRNDPFLKNRPLLVPAIILTPQSIAALEPLGSVRFVNHEMLTRLGLFTERRDDYKRDPFTLGLGKR